MINERRCDSWRQFIDNIRDFKIGSLNSFIFRGQSNPDWKLETTLDRYPHIYDRNSENQYRSLAHNLSSAIESLTSKGFVIGDNSPRNGIGPPEFYEMMIYLRHHGFPSPLLDWSASPYVAAFFAFWDAKPGHDVVIYCFNEIGSAGKLSEPACTTIRGYGGDVIAHPRHYRQQSHYTVCYKEQRENAIIVDRVYVPHEHANFSDDQDMLFKYSIPGTERLNALTELDLMNINAYSLLGSEEGLLNMLAIRYIDLDLFHD